MSIVFRQFSRRSLSIAPRTTSLCNHFGEPITCFVDAARCAIAGQKIVSDIASAFSPGVSRRRRRRHQLVLSFVQEASGQNQYENGHQRRELAALPGTAIVNISRPPRYYITGDYTLLYIYRYRVRRGWQQNLPQEQRRARPNDRARPIDRVPFY